MMFCLLLLLLWCPVGAVFQPGTKEDLQAAVTVAAEGTWTGDPISTWDVSQVTDMSQLFSAYGDCGESCSTYNPDLSQWNVAEVTTMESMFTEASAFNSDISQWNVGKVTTMDGMFYEATSFNSDISQWNVGKVTRMKYMFNQASSFNSDISQWNVGQVTSMSEMFSGAATFNGAFICTWATRPTYPSIGFEDCSICPAGTVSPTGYCTPFDDCDCPVGWSCDESKMRRLEKKHLRKAGRRLFGVQVPHYCVVTAN